MNTAKFNNESEFNEWKERNLIGAIVFEFGEFDSPMMYPCIMVYEFMDGVCCSCSDEEEEFNALIAEGYYSDEIEYLLYHYVYPTDFE